MKNIFGFILIIVMFLANISCNKTVENNIPQNEPGGVSQTETTQGLESVPEGENSAGSESGKNEGEENNMISIAVTVGASTFTAKLYDNETAMAFAAQFPLTMNMSDLNGNEKYHYLPDKFPVDSERAGNIKTGDLMLYGFDCLVLFYKSFSTSYSYTRLGYIEDISGLAAALGSGNIQVTFNISD